MKFFSNLGNRSSLRQAQETSRQDPAQPFELVDDAPRNARVQERLEAIPGNPIAYWIPANLRRTFRERRRRRLGWMGPMQYRRSLGLLAWPV